MARVDLRPVEAADRDRILAWRSAPDVRRHLHSDHPISPDDDASWFAGLADDDASRYWIIDLDGQPVGVASLYDIDPGNRRCAWASYLAEPASRGRGVGSYVEYWVLEYVFEGLKFEKLWCEAPASNEAAWRAHETFGFVVEARLRGHVIEDGDRADVVGLGMLAGDWRQRRPTMAERLLQQGYDPPSLA